MQHNYGDGKGDSPIIRFLLTGQTSLAEIASMLSESQFKRKEPCTGRRYYSLFPASNGRIYLDEWLEIQKGRERDRPIVWEATREQINHEQADRNTQNRGEYERRFGEESRRKHFDPNPSKWDFFKG